MNGIVADQFSGSARTDGLEFFVYWLRGADVPDIAEYLRRVAPLGPETYFVGCEYLREFNPAAAVDAAAMTAAMHETQTRLFTLHGLFGRGRDLGEPDESLRAAARPGHCRTLELAGEWAAHNVVFHLGETFSPKAVDSARRSLDELLPAAQEAHVHIALENLPAGYYGERPEHLLEVFDHYRSPWLGACMDTGHANLLGDVAAQIHALAGHIVTTHIQDNDGAKDQHLPPGHGSIDWPAALTALCAAGYEGPLVSEARLPETWGPREMVEHFREFCRNASVDAPQSRPAAARRG